MITIIENKNIICDKNYGYDYAGVYMNIKGGQIRSELLFIILTVIIVI